MGSACNLLGESSSGSGDWSSATTGDPSPEWEDMALGSTVTLDFTVGAIHASASDEVMHALLSL